MGTRSVLVLSAVCLATVPPAMAGEPSVKDLIKLAPVISSKDRAYESIAINATINDGIHMRFRALYQAPDRHALLITDGSDGTPLVFVANRQMLIYDPVHPAVLRLKDAVSQLTWRTDGDQTKLMFDFGTSSDESRSSELTFDLQSICQLPAVEEKVVKDGDGRYRLFRTSANEDTSVYSIDPSRKMPYTSLKAFSKDSHQPFMNIDRIEVNVVLKDEEFRFPDMARVAEKITVKDMPFDRISGAVSGVAVMMRAAEARLGVNHLGMRKSIRFAALQGIHWDQIRENDRKFSGLMKELIPPEPPGPRALIELPPLPPFPPERPRPAASRAGPALR